MSTATIWSHYPIKSTLMSTFDPNGFSPLQFISEHNYFCSKHGDRRNDLYWNVVMVKTEQDYSPKYMDIITSPILTDIIKKM